jgi:adenine-specific DNA-methyltransferase
MTSEWADPLGLASTPLFAHDAPVAGEHNLLLDGVRGSFAISRVDGADLDTDTRSWAWSSGVLHHVTAAHDAVTIRRWDTSEIARYPLAVVTSQLDRLYHGIMEAQAGVTRNIATHTIDAFRRIRSSFGAAEQDRALSVFLLLLGAMRDSNDDERVFDQPDEVTARFNISPTAADGLRRLSPELAKHVMMAFRRPTSAQAQQLQSIPSLVLRHAGAAVFQEAHFELARRGAPDFWGVPDAASVTPATVGGIHITPPGLARAIVEQALEAYGELKATITILDPACGSGSILHEAVRTLRDRGYTGRLRIIGFDESVHSVEMTRFLLSNTKLDWPTFHIADLHVEQRDSLDDRDWPTSDLILMNPPFVNWRALTQAQKRSLTGILGEYARGRPDLSMAFVERGLRTVAQNGVVGTLLPAGVLAMTNAEGWRRHILDEASVAFLAVFSELGLFRLATVETGCVVLHKAGDHPAYKSLWVGEKRHATTDALRFLRKSTHRVGVAVKGDKWTLDEIPQSHLLTGPSWRPRPGMLQRDVEQLAVHVDGTVGKVFHVKQGALPAPREVFIIDAITWRGLPEKERKWFRRVAENRNIRDGQILPGNYIFYSQSEGLPKITSEEHLRQECPTFFPHLKKHQDALVKRRGKSERWWELGESRRWLRSPIPKIVSAYFGYMGSFAVDRKGDHVVVQGYGWILRAASSRAQSNRPCEDVLKAYVAVLNSRFFMRIASEICPVVGGGQLNFSKRYAERIPLPDLMARDDATHGYDVILSDLATIGEIIDSSGLTAAPRRKAEELVELLYGQ